MLETRDGGFRLVHARFQGPMTQMKMRLPLHVGTNRSQTGVGIARLHESVYSIGFLAHRPLFLSTNPLNFVSIARHGKTRITGAVII